MNFSIIYNPKSKEEFLELWEQFKDLEPASRPRINAAPNNNSTKSEIEQEYNRKMKKKFRFSADEHLAVKLGALTRDQVIQQRMNMSPDQIETIIEEEVEDNVTGL